MLGNSIAVVVAALTLALGACGRQAQTASEAKDVDIVDNGGNVVGTDLLKCHLFLADGWIVYWGTQFNHGSQPVENRRKMTQRDFEQLLVQSLSGSSAASSINSFVRQIVDEQQLVTIDVEAKTVNLGHNTVPLQNQFALAQVAVTAAKLLSTQGQIDTQR